MSDDAALLKALEIKPDDIETNRQGEFSKRQVQKLKGRQRARLMPMALFVLMMVVLILFMASGLLGQVRATGEAPYGPFVGLLMVVLGAMGASTLRLIWREWRKASAAIDQAELKVIRGPIKLSQEKDDNGDTWHYARIGSQKFKVIPPLYQAFEDKAKYAIYYTSTTKEIVGAEKVD